MLTATIKKATLLKKIATVLNNLFHSISIDIKGDTLFILMVSTCQYMLFDISLDLEDVQGEQPLTFSVNARHFLESFSTLKTNDSIKLAIKEDHMIVEILSENCTERSFLHISQSQTLSIENDPEYDQPIQIKDINFQKLCKALNSASQELIVRGNSKRITMRANLEKMFGREVEFGDREAVEDEFEDVYCTENFLSISKISSLSNSLSFYVNAGNPFCIEAKFNDGIFKVYIKHKKLVEQDD